MLDEKRVIADLAIDFVIVAVAVEKVVADAAVDGVVAGPAFDHVAEFGARQKVGAGGAAAAAGVEVGDVLVQSGEIQCAGLEGGDLYRNRYRTEVEGTPLVVRIRRNGQERMLQGDVRFNETVDYAIQEDGRASEKARRIRDGILRGTVEQ